MILALILIVVSILSADTLTVFTTAPSPDTFNLNLFGFALEVGSMPDSEYVANYLATHPDLDFSWLGYKCVLNRTRTAFGLWEIPMDDFSYPSDPANFGHPNMELISKFPKGGVIRYPGGTGSYELPEGHWVLPYFDWKRVVGPLSTTARTFEGLTLPPRLQEFGLAQALILAESLNANVELTYTRFTDTTLYSDGSIDELVEDFEALCQFLWATDDSSPWVQLRHIEGHSEPFNNIKWLLLGNDLSNKYWTDRWSNPPLPNVVDTACWITIDTSFDVWGDDLQRAFYLRWVVRTVDSLLQIYNPNVKLGVQLFIASVTKEEIVLESGVHWVVGNNPFLFLYSCIADSERRDTPIDSIMPPVGDKVDFIGVMLNGWPRGWATKIRSDSTIVIRNHTFYTSSRLRNGIFGDDTLFLYDIDEGRSLEKDVIEIYLATNFWFRSVIQALVDTMRTYIGPHFNKPIALVEWSVDGLAKSIIQLDRTALSAISHLNSILWMQYKSPLKIEFATLLNQEDLAVGFTQMPTELCCAAGTATCDDTTLRFNNCHNATHVAFGEVTDEDTVLIEATGIAFKLFTDEFLLHKPTLVAFDSTQIKIIPIDTFNVYPGTLFAVVIVHDTTDEGIVIERELTFKQFWTAPERFIMAPYYIPVVRVHGESYGLTLRGEIPGVPFTKPVDVSAESLYFIPGGRLTVNFPDTILRFSVQAAVKPDTAFVAIINNQPADTTPLTIILQNRVRGLFYDTAFVSIMYVDTAAWNRWCHKISWRYARHQAMPSPVFAANSAFFDNPEMSLCEGITHIPSIELGSEAIPVEGGNSVCLRLPQYSIVALVKFRRGRLRCPAAFSFSNGNYYFENNILPLSTHPWRTSETDFLKLRHKPTNEGGTYKLQIQELGGVYDFFDRFRLLAVDHTEDSTAAVTTTGKYILYSQTSTIPCAYAETFDGEDITEALSSADGVLYSCDGPGAVDIVFPPLPDASVSNYVAILPPPAKTSEPTVEIWQWSGDDWIKIGSVGARYAADTAYVLLDPAYTFGDSVHLMLTWDVHYEVDAITLAPASIAEPIEFPLISAMHSSGDTVYKNLRGRDASYTGLLPDEYIDLWFVADGGPEPGLVRDFFLQSDGYFLEARFTCVSDSAGLDVPSSGWRGVVWYDYNNDDFQDAAIATPDRFYIFRNNADGTFTPVDDELGIHRERYFCGGVVGDFDNDMDDDIYIHGQLTTTNKSHLYRNDIDSLVDVTDSAVVPGSGNDPCASWCDYDRDGFLDLFVCGASRLYHNNGDGTFTDVTEAAGLYVPENTHSAVWGDYNNDGYPDVFFPSSHFGRHRLFRNEGDGTFVEVTEEALPGNGVPGGHGAIWADFNNDGYLDIYVCSRYSGDQLLINNGDGTFDDVSDSAGLVGESGVVAAAAADYDNDGDLDIYVSKYGGGYNILYNNGNGTFVNVAREAHVDTFSSTHGISWGDYNNDGWMDLLVSPDILYKNLGGDNNWLEIKCIDAGLPGYTNCSAIGVRVTVYAGRNRLMQVVDGGGSYTSQNGRILGFGLGSFDYADSIVVEWTSGLKTVLSRVDANQRLIVYEVRDTLGPVVLEAYPQGCVADLDSLVVVLSDAVPTPDGIVYAPYRVKQQSIVFVADNETLEVGERLRYDRRSGRLVYDVPDSVSSLSWSIISVRDVVGNELENAVSGFTGEGIDTLGPISAAIYPPNNACVGRDEPLRVLVVDTISDCRGDTTSAGAIDVGSIALEVNGKTYTADSVELSYSNGILTFLPVSGWSTAEVAWELVGARDTLGNDLYRASAGLFFVNYDTLPPKVTILEPETRCVDTTQPLLIRIVDTVSTCLGSFSDPTRVDLSAMELLVNGQSYNLSSSEISYDTSAGILMFLPEGGWKDTLVQFELSGIFDVDGNAAEALDSSFSVDVDVMPPVLELIHPTEGCVDTTNYMAFLVYDTFSTCTGEGRTNISEFRLELNGAVFTLDSSQIRYDTVSSILIYEEKPRWHSKTISFEALACDERNNTARLSGNFSVVFDLTGPTGECISPDTDFAVPDTTPIVLRLWDLVDNCEGGFYTDSAGVVDSTVELIVNGQRFDTTSPELSVTAGKLRFRPLPMWSTYRVEWMLSRAEDRWGNPLTSTSALAGTFYVALDIATASSLWASRSDSLLDILPDSAFKGNAVVRRSLLKAGIDIAQRLTSRGLYNAAAAVMRMNLERTDGSCDGSTRNDWVIEESQEPLYDFESELFRLILLAPLGEATTSYERRLFEIAYNITDLACFDFSGDPNSRKRSLCFWISIADKRIERGSFSAAADVLQRKVLRRCDGFYGGDPDDDDWIVTRAGQERVFPSLRCLVDDLRGYSRRTPRNPEYGPETRLMTPLPNPFNAQVKIPFSLSHTTHVRIAIYDVLGKLISVLLDGELPAGHHGVVWNASERLSGVYLCTMTTSEGYIGVVKLLVLR